MTLPIRAALLASCFAASALPSFAQDAQTISVADDGVVTITGITQPGQGLTIPENCSTADNAVVCLAEEFIASLDEDQAAEAVLELTEENSTAWSNLPCGSNCRVGIELLDLTDAQKELALTLVMAAAGTGENSGFDEITQILMADDILTLAQQEGLSSPMGGGGAPDGMEPPEGMEDMTPPDGAPDGGPGGAGGGLAYSSNNYFIAILGDPAGDAPWQLQFGGHHLGVLHTYEGGTEIAATPNFIGIEPKVWVQDGETYAPLTDDRDAMTAMLAALSEDELASAKLDATFSDVLLGPGQDGQFPEEKSGLSVADLSEDQQALVLAAIESWVGDTAASSAEVIMDQYEADLGETYISYSGNPTLDHHADYVRIDGPGVWIEFVCQNGVIFGDQIHYHTIWRDHVNDYGAVYEF